MAKNVVSIKELKYMIGDTSILKDVSFGIEQGCFLGIFGADDSGKSSLLNIIMGFTGKNDFDGKVYRFGKDIKGCFGKRNNRIRFAPDDILWENIRGEEYLQFCKETAGNYNSSLEKELIELFQLPVQSVLTEMTYNENKLCQLVGLMCSNPKLLILDEPCNFINQEHWSKLLEVLDKCNREGMTIVLAVEKHAMLEGYCDRLLYIKDGQVAHCVTYNKEEKRTDYRQKMVGVKGGNKAFLQQYLGEILFESNGKCYYRYEGTTDRLCKILAKASCEDVTIEEMTLEEELDNDFDRWM